MQRVIGYLLPQCTREIYIDGINEMIYVLIKISVAYREHLKRFWGVFELGLCVEGMSVTCLF